ncbi:MAG: hypothetical protein AAF721_05175 [Myxococcota bacterium]
MHSLLCLILSIAPAEPLRGPAFSNDEARVHFEAAVSHFGEQDFAAASEQLRLAYELEAVAELLYARAQAERQLKRWVAAADLYAEYLATDPPKDQAANARPPLLFCRAKAEQEAGNCNAARTMLESYLQVYPAGAEAEMAREALEACAPEPEPPPEPGVVGLTPPGDPVEPTPSEEGTVGDRDPPQPWHQDLAGGILVGIGLGVAGAGATVALAGRAAFVNGQVAPGHDEAVEAMDRGIVLERVGIGIAAAGALVTVAGIGRWITVGVRNRRAERTSALIPVGLGVAWVGRW